MKTLLSVILIFFAAAVFSIQADGIPVDENGKIHAPHTIVDLNPSQVEEVDALGTLTFTNAQWTEIRKVAPGCAKRLASILPVTWNDCTCCVDNPYGIAVARDKVAVLHDSWGYSNLAANFGYEATERSYLSLRVDHRGQFYYNGILIPFQTLLGAFSGKPENLNEEGAESAETRTPEIYVSLPFGMDRNAATLKSRIDLLYKTAEAAGWETPDSER